VRLCLWTAATNWPICHALGYMESHSGMISTGENRRTRRKTCPTATLSTRHGLYLARTRASEVRGRRLTAWVMAWPIIVLLFVMSSIHPHHHILVFVTVFEPSPFILNPIETVYRTHILHHKTAQQSIYAPQRIGTSSPEEVKIQMHLSAPSHCHCLKIYDVPDKAFYLRETSCFFMWNIASFTGVYRLYVA
jgi:hypothetical protein